VRITVPPRGGWRARGTVRADFERALADPVEPAIAPAEIASEVRRGADYVQVTVALTVRRYGRGGPLVVLDVAIRVICTGADGWQILS